MNKGTIICLALAVSLVACKSTHDGELGPETPTPLLAPVFEAGAHDAGDAKHTHTHFLSTRYVEVLRER